MTVHKARFSLLIHILLGISLLFFGFGQLGRLPIPEWPVYVYLYEPCIAVITILLIIHFRKKNLFTEYYWAKWSGIFLMWLVITYGISTFRYSTSQNIVAFLYLLRYGLYASFFIYFFAFLQKYGHSKWLVKRMLWFLVIMTSVFSLVQYTLYQNLGNIAYMGWDPHLGRLVGLFFDPPLTVSIFALLAIYYFFSIPRWSLKIVVTVILLGLSLLTFSRGGYMALIITGLLYLLKHVNKVYALSGLAIIVLCLVFLPSNLNESLNLRRTTSIFTRINDYEKAYKIWQRNSVIGIGYNHIRYEKDKYSEELITETHNPSHAAASFHSSFLMILVTSGIIGLGLYLVMLWKISQIHEVAFYGMTFLSVISLTDNVLLHPFILFLYGVIVSVYVSPRVHNGQ